MDMIKSESVFLCDRISQNTSLTQRRFSFVIDTKPNTYIFHYVYKVRKGDNVPVHLYS